MSSYHTDIRWTLNIEAPKYIIQQQDEQVCIVCDNNTRIFQLCAPMIVYHVVFAHKSITATKAILTTSCALKHTG